MKLVVVIVLAYVASSSAQFGFGAVGSKVGSRVGAEIGLLTGTVLDTVPSVVGMSSKPDPPPRGRGSGGRGGGAGREYIKESDNVRERTVAEREEGKNYETGRSWQGGGRGRGGRRPNIN